MAYIRCLSNPEGLYIYGGTDGRVNIHHCIPAPFAKPAWTAYGKTNPWITVPSYIFRHVCRRWRDRWHDHVRYRGCEVKEEFVRIATGKTIPARSKLPAGQSETRLMVKFSYKKNHFYMWGVTWDHVVGNLYERD